MPKTLESTQHLSYQTCKGKQLIQALNHQGQLGKVYQGLTKYIVTKYGSSCNLAKLTYQACAKSLIALTFILLEKGYEVHIDINGTTFPIHQTKLEAKWFINPHYKWLPQEEKSHAWNYLDKLFHYNITKLNQIQNPNGIIIISST